MKPTRILKNTFFFLICVLTSFFIKTCHYNMEAARMASLIQDSAPLWHGDLRDALPVPRPNFMPYSIESAMMFAYAQDVAEGKSVPARDPRLAYLPDVPPYAQMNMSLEWVLGWSWRMKNRFFPPQSPSASALRYQDHPDFAAWCAVSVRFWTALIPGLIFLWLLALRVPSGLAFAGGMLHAVSVAAIARATGQDIVRGDFCIPLILLCFVLAHSFYGRPKRWKLLCLGAAAFAAFAAWDLSRLLFGAWGCFEIFRSLIGGRPGWKRRSVWIVISAAIVLNALIVPFNVTYGLIMSPLVCILLPLLLFQLFMPKMPVLKRLFLFVSVWGILWGFYSLCVDNPGYRANYSHFAEAMRAKWEFHNVKPADPSKLSYDARIMWTPSMHSADWRQCVSFFPSLGSLPLLKAKRGPAAFQYSWNLAPITLSFVLLLLAAGGLFTPVRRAILLSLPRSSIPYLFTLGFFVGFYYIVRYHEFVIIFLALSFALTVHAVLRGLRAYGRSARFLKRSVVALTVLAVLLELYAVCGRSRIYGKDVYFRETADLIAWFRQSNLRGSTVLADFTIGPMLMAYCGTNLVLQPQFGMEPIRRPVERYLKLLYHGDEADLSDFCSKYKVKWMVYDRGTVGPLHPYSIRYIADAEEFSRKSPAYRMYYEPEKMTGFYPVKPPVGFSGAGRKFTVFKVIGFDDRMEAFRLCSEARKSLRRKNRREADRLLRESLNLDPGLDEARELFFLMHGRMPELTLKGII